MNQREKENLIASLIDDFPTELNYEDLSKSKKFLDWFGYRLSILKESDFWEKDILNELQERRLNTLLEYMKKNSPFWKNYLQNNECDLKQLPITNKAFLLKYKENDAFIFPKDSRNLLHNLYSSGTSGIAVSVTVSRAELVLISLSYFLRHPLFSEEDISFFLQNKFLFFLGKGKQNFSFFYEHFFLDNFAKLDDFFVRSSIYSKISNSNPILCGLPSLISEFARYAENECTPDLRAICLFGESSTPEEIQKIGKVFGAPVMQIYGSRETDIIGLECPFYFGQNYYHIPMERLIIEIVDEDGNNLPPGSEGAVIITVLDRKVTPIIRYEIGDTGRIIEGACPCGRTSSLIAFGGRKQNFIIFPDGKTKFNMLHFWGRVTSILGAQRIRQYQVVQESFNKIIINLVPIQPLNIQEVNIISSILTNILNRKIDIQINQVKSISTSGKKVPGFVPLNK